MKSERHVFLNRNREELVGILDLPDETEPKFYALYAHCFTCSKNLKSIVWISRTLIRYGIAVFRFDFTGIAESGGDFSSTLLMHNVADIVAAAEFLQKKFESPQLLIGHSLGGSAIQLAAPKIATARALVLIASPYEPSHLGSVLTQARERALQEGETTVTIGGNRFRLTAEFFKDLQRHSSSPIDSRLALLICHSPQDQTVPMAQALKTFQSAKGDKSLISLGSADHILSRKGDAVYAGNVIGLWALYVLGV
ncbi:alpha/beta fold hydrolase [candidate division KSB1 bacterium]|nr:alpha/beta fold hydrolase [candidate division KSB1 bacterium]